MENHRAHLLDTARELSSSPGVYLMKDERGEILYVGKAKNLRNRVSQYFQPAPHEAMRTEMMITRVRVFEVILTETESEALILECTLIKKNKPRFNIRLKDDKTYPYIKIQPSDAFPRLEWTRKVRKDGGLYFGPFPSAWSARQTLRLLTEMFKLRDCSDNTFRHRSRPCILYQMGKCTAPCVGIISHSEYQTQIQEVVAILEGKSDQIVEGLEREMKAAAAQEDFETAALLRDQIQNLNLVTQTQSVIEAGKERDRDVLGVARDGTLAHGTVLQIRAGKLMSVKHYTIQNSETEIREADLLFNFLSQHYLQNVSEESGESSLLRPKEVLVPEIPTDFELIEKTVHVTVKVQDDRDARTLLVDQQLLNVARTNAKYALDQAKKREGGHGIAALEEVFNKLHLAKVPHRIECYDISNTQGDESVASRVVFIAGAPEKSLYRKYKIKTVIGANDFAMMKEVLNRRFSRLEEELPDLVVVDGGKGQLAQAVAIMEELNIQGVEVVGLAKARTESDFTKTEVESSMERIFIPGRKNPVPLPPHTAAYKLLTHIRDEAHRFAITYHRLLRSKKSLGRE